MFAQFGGIRIFKLASCTLSKEKAALRNHSTFLKRKKILDFFLTHNQSHLQSQYGRFSLVGTHLCLCFFNLSLSVCFVHICIIMTSRSFGRFTLVGTHTINTIHKFLYNPVTRFIETQYNAIAMIRVL